jgi:hypothetical protein
MTDEFAPGGPGSPEPPSPVAAATGRQPGGRRAVIIIGVIVAFLAIVLFAVRNNVQADDLKVGECFDIPSGTSIQTVEHHPCNESHTAEVIHVAEYTGEGSSYPISLSLDSFVETACVPAFQMYAGREINADPDLSIGYFYPSRDGWSSGDRTITCYVARSDEGPMTQSVKGSASP